MRIDVRDGVLVEGSADELVAFADAILAAANHGPECVGAFLAPTGVTPVYVLRVGGPPAAVTPVSPPAAARAPSAGGS
jgi:hypothetical protein